MDKNGAVDGVSRYPVMAMVMLQVDSCCSVAIGETLKHGGIITGEDVG